MTKSLLSAKQKQFLNFVSSEKNFFQSFYLTGGTVLSEYYLKHRYSEDLDFFNESEFESKDITIFLESSKKKFGNPGIDFTQSFNRNIYQLLYPKNKILKVEFTYFPFKRIEKVIDVNNISIDSLLDITVNKLFTIHQNPRGRDYFDLYSINNKREFSIETLIKLARIKFDTNIDLLQLGSNMIKAGKLLDDPILISKIPLKKIEEYFIFEAKKLKKNLVE